MTKSKKHLSRLVGARKAKKIMQDIPKSGFSLNTEDVWCMTTWSSTKLGTEGWLKLSNKQYKMFGY